jgi:predicted ATPase/DNA-binding CsgD family transcriptional regulator
MAGGGWSGSRVGRLPADVTDFVGRRQEIAEVRRLLARARLVTLTGAGGTGKTRLALRVAAEVRRGYPDGVWLVDLAPVLEEALVEYTIAESLGIRGQSDRDLGDILGGFLCDRELVLVLDNCEHVLDAAASFVDRMLRTAPGLRVLCTSRQPLGTISEHVWRVPPLPVPAPGEVVAPGMRWRYPSILLFAERAAAAEPGFELTPANQDRVAEICRRLDGLPLAIELAAAQLRTLTVDQLEARLVDRLPALHTRHAVPAHHRTLEATFDWSFELATPAERALWTSLSVFVDGIDLDAAEYVCADGEPLLDVISGLVDKSILMRDESTDGVRYRLLETVRQYGLSQLRRRGGDELALRRRHRDWYLRLAERLNAEWFAPREEEWSARLRREQSNVRAAINFCLTAESDSECALHIVYLLQYYWVCCGAQQEGRYWLGRALAANPRPSLAKAKAYAVLSRVLQAFSEPVSAMVAAQECLALARDLAEPALVARATVDLAISQFLSGADLPGAQAMLEGALDVISDDDLATRAAAMSSLAMVLLYQGKLAEAAQLCAASRAFCRTHGDRWWLAVSLAGSAMLEVTLGDTQAAEAYLRECVMLVFALGDIGTVIRALDLFALAAASGGDDLRAARLMGSAHGIRRVVGEIGLGSHQIRGYRDKTYAGARQRLGAAVFDAAYAAGCEMSIDDAVDYASRATGPVAPAPVSPGPAPTPLTRRELEVVALVAEGLTNRQIATKLVIAPRTAESHVENILRKLAFTGRTQIAAWHAERVRNDHR